jgi:HAD superfamily hydrolase (TIGR01509 family)
MRPARITVTALFLADGLLVGTWASRIPAVKHEAGLTDSGLGLALFAAALGALVAMPIAGWLTVRVGSRAVAVAALLTGSAALATLAFAGSFAVVALALFGFGAGVGATNVAVNAQGLLVERAHGRSILSSFHAGFSAGALAGAAAGALVAAGGVGPRAHFAVVGLVVGALALAGAQWLLPRAADDRRRAPVLARPPRALVLIGAAAFVTMLAEGAAADWSAVYLSASVGAGPGVAGFAYAMFSVAMVASRLSGDRVNERIGPAALVRVGGLLAASGLAFALIGASPLAGLMGFAAMGAGLGVVVPVLFRAAGTSQAVASGVGVAAVSTIGWLGFLAGPPAIGFTAGAVGLPNALWIVVGAALSLALLARSVEPRRSERWAVLSDLDGVLVDSAAAIEGTWRRFAYRHGLDPERVLAEAHGRRAIDLIRLVAPHLDAAAEFAVVEREEIELSRHLEPLPGARELVAAVPADRFAIVTSGSRALAEERLRAAGIPIPSVLVTADQVERGKPDPSGYLRAAELLGVEPRNSFVLEDAPVGVDAGLAAGMTVIAVLTTSEESTLQRAHRRIRDLQALLPVPERLAEATSPAATG